MRHANSRKQKPKIIINFCHRSYSRTRIAAGRLLVNRNRWTKSFNRINIRLVHRPQKLTRIRIQALHITTLTLGVNRIKCQAGFPRPTKPSNHHQLISRNLNIYIFQIVLTSTFNTNYLCHNRYIIQVFNYFFQSKYRRKSELKHITLMIASQYLICYS